MLGRHLVSLADEVAEPSASGSSTANDSTSVCSCVASVRPGVNGTVTGCPRAQLGRLLDGGAAAEHNQVGERDLLLPALLRRVERLLDALEGPSAPWPAPADC